MRDVYEKLIEPKTTAIALIGIAGVGKSTLAVLIYHYAEKQRLANHGPFTAPALWITIDPSVTITSLGETLLKAQSSEEPILERSMLLPQSPVEKLLNALNSHEARLVIMDQFDNLLDKRTGLARADVPGLREWLDAINSQPCKCRVLFTSCLLPQGSGLYLPPRIKEHHVDGLKNDEGVKLLKEQGVEASWQDLRTAVERCAGHGFALVLLVFLLKHSSLSLANVLKDPKYNDFWNEDIVRRLHKHIEHLNPDQWRLLLASSIYREPAPLEAAEALMDSSTKLAGTRLRSLLEHHLLKAPTMGHYQAHPIAAIIIDYLQRHLDADNEQVSQQALWEQHARAAQYYLDHRCPPQGQQPQSNDIPPLIEAAWHQCQAEQWTEAYTLMPPEGSIPDLYSIRDLQKREEIKKQLKLLLELCKLLLSSDKWQPTSPEAKRIRSYQDGIYQKLENA